MNVEFLRNPAHAKLKITLTPSRDFQLGVSVIFNLRELND
jgi:hypothetical protein